MFAGKFSLEIAYVPVSVSWKYAYPAVQGAQIFF